MDRPANGRVERGFVPLELAQFRVEPIGDGSAEAGARIVGYVAVYNQWSPVYFGSYRERIAPGFFDPALGQDVRALFNHDANFVLGRTRSQTLALASDEVGLRATIEVGSARTIQDLVVEPMRRGDVTGASFSFNLPQEGGSAWNQGADGIMERTLVRCETLWDVGPVTFPFYPQTELALRSLESWVRENVAPPAEFSRSNRERRAALSAALHS